MQFNLSMVTRDDFMIWMNLQQSDRTTPTCDVYGGWIMNVTRQYGAGASLLTKRGAQAPIRSWINRTSSSAVISGSSLPSLRYASMASP